MKVQVQGEDYLRYPFAEDLTGVWHTRRNATWSPFIAGCGRHYYSVHVSEFPPGLGDGPARHCRGCFVPASMAASQAASVEAGVGV